MTYYQTQFLHGTGYGGHGSDYTIEVHTTNRCIVRAIQDYVQYLVDQEEGRSQSGFDPQQNGFYYIN